MRAPSAVRKKMWPKMKRDQLVFFKKKNLNQSLSIDLSNSKLQKT